VHLVQHAQLEALPTQEWQDVNALLALLGIQHLTPVTNVLLVNLPLLEQPHAQHAPQDSSQPQAHLNVPHAHLEALPTQEWQDVNAQLLALFGIQPLTCVINVQLVNSLLLVQPHALHAPQINSQPQVHLNVPHAHLKALLTQEWQDVNAQLLDLFGIQPLTRVTNVQLVNSLLLEQPHALHAPQDNSQQLAHLNVQHAHLEALSTQVKQHAYAPLALHGNKALTFVTNVLLVNSLPLVQPHALHALQDNSQQLVHLLVLHAPLEALSTQVKQHVSVLLGMLGIQPLICVTYLTRVESLLLGLHLGLLAPQGISKL
jgi:antitoxin component of MazEF toxin-antitoxin module